MINDPDNAVWLSRPQLRRRFGGISDRTLYRWEESLDLPPGTDFNGRIFRRLADIEAWEQLRAEATKQAAEARVAKQAKSISDARSRVGNRRPSRQDPQSTDHG